MARGTQLLQLVTMLRDETDRANSVAVGVDDLPRLKQILARVQETLYDKHDWPFLRKVFDRITLQAGQRFYDLPDELNLERILDVRVWDGSMPRPVVRGITLDDYEVYDPEDDERCDPALKWDVQAGDDVGQEQIEIWPLPATNDQKLQFVGIRKLRPLIANDDRAELDDRMIVLYAAAELLPKDSEEAKLKLELARDRYNTLKGRVNNNGARYRQGMGSGVEPDSGRVVVRVSR